MKSEIRLLMVMVLIMSPGLVSAQYVNERFPANTQRALLACDFTSQGLTVAMFESGPGDLAGLFIDPVPEPGDRCLPFLSSAIDAMHPFWTNGGQATNALLRSGTPESLLYTLSLADRTKYVIACRVQTGQGLVATEIFKVTEAADATSLIGQPCLSVVGRLAANSGYQVSGPMATRLGGTAGATGSGPVWFLGGSFCEGDQGPCQTKVFRCDYFGGDFVVSYAERSGDSGPDPSLLGESCLDTLAKEQGPPEGRNGPRLQAAGPVPSTQAEECLIFDFLGNGLMLGGR